MSDTIKIRILLFASLKEITGVHRFELTINKGTTISELKGILIQQYASLAGKIEHCLTAIDHKYAQDSQEISFSSEIAFFPPVSGGSFSTSIIKITTKPIDANAIIQEISNSRTGAVNAFIGVVRKETIKAAKTLTIKQLEYEAFEAMAIEKMKLIEQEIRQKWQDIEGVAIIQRTGRLTPGTPSVIIACSAPHRDSGIFEATRYAIDRLKQIVPVWKKEISMEGEEWIEGEYLPGEKD